MTYFIFSQINIFTSLFFLSFFHCIFRHRLLAT